MHALARSIQTFGFNAPILIDKNGMIVCGHGRLEAAKLLKLDKIPVIGLYDLSADKVRAYMIADNKLTDRSAWDDHEIALHLKELSELCPDFEIEVTGFETPEIDIRIQSITDQPLKDADDDYEPPAMPVVSREHDVWFLGDHVAVCGSALDERAYDYLPDGARAAAVFTDPPYNVKIGGNVSGLGKRQHREFVQASGEKTPAEFTDFLASALKFAQAHTCEGAILYVCMDWRHLEELIAAGRICLLELLNVCVWVKTNGGMGSFYRSKYELVFVFRNGGGPHRNNVQLGRFGRNRNNVWLYPGANVPGKGREKPLDFHPTPKPIALVADALLDSTARGDWVLDPFLGSGTTLLAAERTGRKAYGIELDPIYVDTVVQRWQNATGRVAYHQSGKSFAEMAVERVGP